MKGTVMKRIISIVMVVCMLGSLMFVSPSAKGVAISHIDLTGLAEPQNSVYPGFTLVMPSNAHFKLDTTEGINGIEWRDLTAGKDLTTTDKFVSAHEYRVIIHLVADSDYYFYRYTGEAYVLTTVNGTTCATSFPYNSEKYLDIYYYPKVVGAEKLEGSVFLLSDPKAGVFASFGKSGGVANVSLSDLQVQWQRRASTSDPFENIAGANSMTYTPTGYDVGKYLRVKVGAKGYYNYLYSDSKKVVKSDNNAEPTPANFYIDGDQLYLMGVVGQQYVVTLNKRAQNGNTYDLNEGDWKWSYQINYTYDQKLNITLAAEMDKYVYVYTRFMETDEKKAGTKVAFSQCYFKENYRLTDVQLTCETPESDLIEGGVAKFCVDPVPSNATNFNGIRGDNWSVDGSYLGSEYGALYANPACTVPLDESTSYKTVYVKLKKAKNGLQVAVVTQIGYTDFLRDSVSLNVKAKNGLYNVKDIGCVDVGVFAGGYIDFVPIYPSPSPANMSYVSINNNNGSGSPYVWFADSEADGITIDATNAVPGTYYYSFYNGSYNIGSFKVIVFDPNPPRRPGDCNNDGWFDNKDVVLLFRYVSGNEKEEDETLYDFDENGVPDNKDVVALFRFVSSSENEPKG